jgi:DNA-binding transcriptional LysR family regulator
MTGLADDLRILDAVLRTGSFARAAAMLGVDRTTVARRIDAIESRYRIVLFVRSRGMLKPTDSAVRLGERAGRVLRELQEIEADALRPDSGVRGVVRIATTEGLGAWLARSGLAAIVDLHPELSLEIATGAALVDLDRGDADLAVRTVRPRSGSASLRRLATLEIALHASRAYIERHGAPGSVTALSGHRLLVGAAEIGRLPESRLLRSVRGARVVLASSSMSVLVEAATTGVGIVATNVGWGQAAGLVRTTQLPSIAPRSLWLQVAAGARDRPAVRVVAKEIARLLSGVR